MEPKLKAMRAELGSFLRQAVNSFKRSLGASNVASEGRAGQGLGEAEPLSPQAYLLAKRHLAESEAQKAWVLVESRQERCKAGGPV